MIRGQEIRVPCFAKASQDESSFGFRVYLQSYRSGLVPMSVHEWLKKPLRVQLLRFVVKKSESGQVLPEAAEVAEIRSISE